VIRNDRSDGIAEIVLRRPPANALTIADLRNLAAMIESSSADDSVRAVIIRADGAGFSAGIDYKELQSPNGRELLVDSGLACRHALSAIARCTVPVIVAVQGYCRGIGVALAAAADLVIASSDAHFALPEGSWSVAYFARMLPPMRLRQLVLTGDRIEAAELAGYGALYRVVEPDQLRTVAREVAESLRSQPRGALTAAKARLNIVDPIEAGAAFWQEQGIVFDTTAVELHSYRNGTNEQ
jgi:enoyl-CoA hydratase